MSADVSYLTAEGAERLKNELTYLKGPGREQIAQRLRAAIQLGDLSENADYITAKEDQAFLEGRIMELDQVLNRAVIIEELEQNLNEVGIGDHVTVQEDDFPPETYHIVGPKEADPRKNRISYESPIGKAIMGRKPGDKVTAETPAGSLNLTVLKIE